MYQMSTHCDAVFAKVYISKWCTPMPFPVPWPTKKTGRLWRLSFPAAGSRYQLCLRRPKKNRAKNTINKRIFKALHTGMLMANNTHRHSQILDALAKLYRTDLLPAGAPRQIKLPSITYPSTRIYHEVREIVGKSIRVSLELSGIPSLDLYSNLGSHDKRHSHHFQSTCNWMRDSRAWAFQASWSQALSLSTKKTYVTYDHSASLQGAASPMENKSWNKYQLGPARQHQSRVSIMRKSAKESVTTIPTRPKP